MTTRNYKSKFHFGSAELPYKYNSCVLRRSKKEKKYRDLALNLIDVAGEKNEHWLATSGFENADHCINDLDDKRGYWELVYISIASNMVDYNIHL